MAMMLLLLLDEADEDWFLQQAKLLVSSPLPRARSYVTRNSLVAHHESPMFKLLSARKDLAYLQAFRLTVQAFDKLHQNFQRAFLTSVASTATTCAPHRTAAQTGRCANPLCRHLTGPCDGPVAVCTGGGRGGATGVVGIRLSIIIM